MKYLFFFLFLESFVLHARERDSTRWDYRLKGIDFNFGNNAVHAGADHFVNAVNGITPAEEKSRFDYSKAELLRSGATYGPLYIRVSSVFSNNHDHYGSFFSKRELKFGIGFEIEPSVRYAVGGLHYGYNNLFIDTVQIRYTYQCQYIQASYQLASRPFLRYFALFGGVNGRFGINTYKQVEMFYKSYSATNPRPENYNVSYFSSGLHLGLKYNFSCDLNFFAEYEAGINAYGKGIEGIAQFSGGGIGMRYKIIDEQDRPKYELMKYW